VVNAAYLNAIDQAVADEGPLRNLSMITARSSRGLSALIVSVAMVAAADAGTITGLGIIAPQTASVGNAVSGDGQAVAGFGGGGGTFNKAYRWTAGGGIANLSVLSGDTQSVATGISADGSVVVGNSTSSLTAHPFIWTEGDGMINLGYLPGHDAGNAYGVSADGTVIVGSSFHNVPFALPRAYRLVGAVMQDLGTLAADSGSIAYAVSADGSTVVGGSALAAFRWTSGTGMVNIGGGTSNDSRIAYAVSGDGSVVTGRWGGIFRWTAADGMVALGALPTGNIATGLGITADGSMIVGTSNSSQGQRAVMWTAATGVVDLNSYLPTFGVDLTGWTLTYARAVSGNGRSITGEGQFNGQSRAWLVTGLPSTCRADFNGSGAVSVQDIFDFLADYFAGEFDADFNNSHTLSVQDIFDFLAAYFTGCR
jgi:probable HAF family extracellular repeat protein